NSKSERGIRRGESVSTATLCRSEEYFGVCVGTYCVLTGGRLRLCYPLTAATLSPLTCHQLIVYQPVQERTTY
uniref:Ovule protein n=1 Tax=Ascaris lumbricoides TaxID=6252 RepID=A0A0M3IIA9_ASCLU